VVTFPGGDYFVVAAGDPLALSADGTDPGSDDLTFTWNAQPPTTYFNDGVGPDLVPSPLGTFPFAVSDATDAVHATPGVDTVSVLLADDDGGTDQASADVLVTGNAEDTRSSGWWKHQYSGKGKPHVDADIAAGYLEVVNAASSVFSEATTLTTEQVDAVLSPSPGDRRDKATAALLVAWLEFASGAVSHTAEVPLSGGDTVAYLDLMFAAEAAILDGTATDAELRDITHDLNRVRHAG